MILALLLCYDVPHIMGGVLKPVASSISSRARILDPRPGVSIAGSIS